MWFPRPKIEKRIEHFWIWFQSAPHELGEPPNEPVRGLSKQLCKIHKGLVWGCAVPDENGVTLLEISPDGDAALADIARLVVKLAPNLPGWKIVAFRQPVDFRSIQVAGLTTDDLGCKIAIFSDGTTEHLKLYYPDHLDEKLILTIGPIFLDSVIGEENVLRFELMHPRPLSEAPEGAIPIEDFATFFNK